MEPPKRKFMDVEEADMRMKRRGLRGGDSLWRPLKAASEMKRKDRMTKFIELNHEAGFTFLQDRLQKRL